MCIKEKLKSVNLLVPDALLVQSVFKVDTSSKIPAKSC